MNKLYPPYLDGILPAFALDKKSFLIPFSHNPSVSKADISGYKVLIKTITNPEPLIELSVSEGSASNYLVVNLATRTKKQFVGGSYYKIQIAYVDQDGKTGHYSTVGVAKCCSSSPDLYITQVHSINYNDNPASRPYLNSNMVKGIYRNAGDSTEKVYSYSFSLYDDKKNLLEQSKEKLHNSSKDTETNQSEDTWKFETTLEENKTYYIVYKVVTTNKMICSKQQIFESQPTLLMTKDISLVAENNHDNGYISLRGIIKDRLRFGHFVLLRTDEKSNFKNWTQILAFDVQLQIGEFEIWKDLTIEQGIVYQYALQEKNQNNIYTTKLKSNKIVAEFEDTFLFDGEKQLNIKFNPDVSSFKETVLENKIETIGSQFPFTFRNGIVKYKEFSLSGLISYNMDTDDLFVKGIDLGVLSDDFGRKTTQSTETIDTLNLGKNTHVSELNVTIERKFKLEVLNWLNDGKIKCLKSPTEGNYLVRLTGISLSPEKQLGRMLHSFSCNAYEVKEYNMNNIIELWYQDKINKALEKFKAYTEFTYPLFLVKKGKASQRVDTQYYDVYPKDWHAAKGASKVWFQDIKPGTMFSITYSDNNTPETIIINNSGSLSLDCSEGQLITSVFLQEDKSEDFMTGQITYGYEGIIDTEFDQVSDLEINKVIGRHFRYENHMGQNILENIDNFKDSITKFYAIQFNRVDSTVSTVYDAIKNLYSNNKISAKRYNYLKSLSNTIHRHFKPTQWTDTKEYYVLPTIQAEKMSRRYELNKEAIIYEILNNINVGEYISYYYYTTYITTYTGQSLSDYFTEKQGYYQLNTKIPDNVLRYFAERYIISPTEKSETDDLNWYIISDDKKNIAKSYLNYKPSILYLDNIEDIKYIELGPNVEAHVSYELLTITYDIESKMAIAHKPKNQEINGMESKYTELYKKYLQLQKYKKNLEVLTIQNFYYEDNVIISEKECDTLNTFYNNSISDKISIISKEQMSDEYIILNQDVKIILAKDTKLEENQVTALKSYSDESQYNLHITDGVVLNAWEIIIPKNKIYVQRVQNILNAFFSEEEIEDMLNSIIKDFYTEDYLYITKKVLSNEGAAQQKNYLEEYLNYYKYYYNTYLPALEEYVLDQLDVERYQSNREEYNKWRNT